MSKYKIAIVVQRYGEEVNGGAELHARWLAEHLLPLAEVHVLTTCAIDYHTWTNVYPPGESELNGVRIHRFAVDGVRHPDLPLRTAALFQPQHTIMDELQWLKDQGPFSPDLLDFIRTSYARYDLYLFMTYLYATTYFGLQLVSDKAILMPLAHDEPYLRLPMFRHLFHLPQAIVYNTEPEKKMVNALMHNAHLPQIVAGVGINVPQDVSAARFRVKYDIEGNFLLYIGRVDDSKNVPELLDFFMRFREEHEQPLKLLFIGKVHMNLPQRPDIVSLGFVSEQDKFDALRAAAMLVMPSQFESLSMVCLEAWLMETPVLVNGRCEVLRYQCRQSNGGLYYYVYEGFALSLTRLLADPALRRQLGRQGRTFVAKRYDWDIVVAKFQALLQVLVGGATDEEKLELEIGKERHGAQG